MFFYHSRAKKNISRNNLAQPQEKENFIFVVLSSSKRNCRKTRKKMKMRWKKKRNFKKLKIFFPMFCCKWTVSGGAKKVCNLKSLEVKCKTIRGEGSERSKHGCVSLERCKTITKQSVSIQQHCFFRLRSPFSFLSYSKNLFRFLKKKQFQTILKFSLLSRFSANSHISN